MLDIEPLVIDVGELKEEEFQGCEGERGGRVI